MFAPKVVPCPLSVARKSARWERSATIEVRRLTGELRGTGLTLADIAVELGASARQLTAWRSGENQPPHWALLALRALLEERKRFGRPRLLATVHAVNAGLIAGEQASHAQLADQKVGSKASAEDSDRNGVTDGESAARNAARPGVTPGETGQLRGGAGVARRAHNPKVAGANPALATTESVGPSRGHRDTEESARPLAVQAQVSGTAGETAPISREAA